MALKDLDEARIYKKELREKKSINKMLYRQEIPLENLKGLFPNANIEESDVNNINKAMKFGDKDKYSEFIALCVQHRDILSDPDCPDFISYVEAMKFISYLNVGKRFDEAYALTKSQTDEEIREMMLSELPSVKDKLKHKASLYSRSKLVVKLKKMLDIPYNLMFANFGYQAIEVLHKEMTEAHLAKDRIQAADRLLAHIEPKLEQMNNIQVNVNTGESKSIVDSYKEALLDFTKQQLDLIKQDKENVKQIINVTPKGEEND